MTEEQWLNEATRPQFLASHLFPRGRWRIRRRRAYLLGVALHRRHWPAESERAELLVIERYADGQCDENEFVRSRAAVIAADPDYGTSTYHLKLLFHFHAEDGTLPLLRHILPRRTPDDGWCDLIREIAGNPFRPWKAIPEAMGGGLVQPDGATVFPSSVARAVAAGIAADQAFDRLPVLADALEDSGVTDAEILGHCRRPGGHLRGCWAVDVVTGKGGG